MRSDNPNLCKAATERGALNFLILQTDIRMGTMRLCWGIFLKIIPETHFYLATKVKPAGVDRDGKPSDQTTADDFLLKFIPVFRD